MDTQNAPQDPTSREQDQANLEQDALIPVDPFVAQTLLENDQQYGDELRKMYGEDLINESQAFLGSLNQAEFEAAIEEQVKYHGILAAMKRAGETPRSEVVQEAVAQHLTYLKQFGDYYNVAAYRGLGTLYATDQRFVEYYEAFDSGFGSWFNEAIQFYCDNWELELDSADRVRPDHKAHM